MRAIAPCCLALAALGAGCAEECEGLPASFQLDVRSGTGVGSMEVIVGIGGEERGRIFNLEGALDDGETSLVVELDRVAEAALVIDIAVTAYAGRDAEGTVLGEAQNRFSASPDGCNHYLLDLAPRAEDAGTPVVPAAVAPDAGAPTPTPPPDAGAVDPCRSTCTQSCDFSCRAECASCDFACDSSSTLCRATCGQNAICALACGGAQQCEADCSGGSHCEVDCAGVRDCTSRCGAGSACRLQCRDAIQCRFVGCPGGQTTCPDGSIVCARACP